MHPIRNTGTDWEDVEEKPTSHFRIIAKGAWFVDPVLLQELLVPGTAVQRVSET